MSSNGGESDRKKNRFLAFLEAGILLMEVSLMLRAVWNGVVLAEAPRTIWLEGNHYFPPEALNREFFTTTKSWSVCPWKGVARYYTVVADGETNRNAAWYYPHPSPLARKIKNHVAFWNGVRVEGKPEP